MVTREPHPEDVAEVLCAVSARLDILARRRAARGAHPGQAAAPAIPIPRSVSLTDVPWATKSSLKRFDPRPGAHLEASSAPALSAPLHSIFLRSSSADAASRASTALGSSFAEGHSYEPASSALARRRRVKAPPKLCLMTGAESASEQASRGALRSRGFPSDDAPEGNVRSAREALSSTSAAAALASAILSLLALLLSAASSLLAPLFSSRPPWWPQSCESPQRPARQGEGHGHAPVSPWSAGLDLLFIDWMDFDSF